jgi:hypothetical protein
VYSHGEFSSNSINYVEGLRYSINFINDPSIYGEFKHEVRQFEKSYDNQQAEQISLMV